MSYQLKTSGIAAHCTLAVAVDPDTNQIKDFASAETTAALTVDSGIVIGEQAWNGTSRKYFKLATGHFVGFGATRPQLTLNSDHPQLTVVWIGEAAGAQVRVFGDGTNSYFCSQNTGSGGSNCPYFVLNSNNANGLMPALPAGTKYLFGFSLDRGAGNTAYRALDTAAAMTTAAAGNPLWSGSYPISFIGRRNDNTTQQADKIHAVLMFDAALSAADWDALRDDWFGTLFEAAGGDDTLDLAASGGAVASGSATADVTAPPVLSITSEPLTDNTGALLANEALVYAAIYHPESGELVVRQTGLATDAEGRYTVTDPALASGIDYLHDWLTVAGARRMPAKAAE